MFMANLSTRKIEVGIIRKHSWILSKGISFPLYLIADSMIELLAESVQMPQICLAVNQASAPVSAVVSRMMDAYHMSSINGQIALRF
jgi:hypothetical protein